MKLWNRAVCVTAVALAAGISMGCAEEREPINTVQPNAMAKTFFVGEQLQDTGDDPSFYARAVITDVSYGAAQDGLFTSTYAQPVSILKWEITEDLLIGRITYNRINNSDEHGEGPADIDGQVAYAFPIQSHFDIRRDYNRTTGEEGNVIVENSSDRAWYERSYFRVDWSRNLNTDAYDFDTLSLVGVYGSISYEPLAYYVTDPTHPDAPHFALDEGYFDITNKAFATPGLIDLSHLGWGIDSFPACYLPNDLFGGSAPYGNCNPVEITLRMSFRRVEKSDYEPVDWTEQFTSFGIFYGERHGYDRGYGIVDKRWKRIAARYNIWDQSHAYKDSPTAGYTASVDFPGKFEARCYTAETTPNGGNPNRDENPANGTADECELVGEGSQCDDMSHKCTLPYRQRKEQPIVWHYTKRSNAAYFDGTDWATHDWDVAMRTAVQVAKYAECTRVTQGAAGDVQGACLAAYPMYTGQQEENDDAVNLAREVDDCRTAFGAWAQENGGSAPWSSGRMEYCAAQADTIGAARGYTSGVIAIAKMPEMITLCHTPLTSHDSPECVRDIQKAMPAAAKAADPRRILPDSITPVQCEEQWELKYSEPSRVDESILSTCDNGFFVRMGDLRYHQVNAIKNPQSPSAWGIMVDADDPLTGEKVQASINIWTHVNDLAAQGAIDTLRYIAGEITTEEITEGKYVRDWASAVESAGGKGALGTMDKKTVNQRLIGALDGRTLDSGTPTVDAENIPQVSPELLDKARKLMNTKISRIKSDASTMAVDRPEIDARRVAAQNTPTEAALITPEMMELSGMNRAEIKAASSELSAGSVGQSSAGASILRSMNPQIARDLRVAKEIALANRGACILSSDQIMSPAPNTLANLGKAIGRKFGDFNPSDDKATQQARSERIRSWLTQKLQYGVIVHEMGHSIGERHNFVSSYFSYGYRPQYWQLRTDDGNETGQCPDVSATGADCVGPRYFDPPTDDEQDNLLPMWQMSSVMDYPGEIAQDLLGLGAYDFAAARMFYGQAVAVHADTKFNAGEDNGTTVLNVTDGFGGIAGYQWVNGNGDPLHYTALQDELGLISDCVQIADPMLYQPKGYDVEKYGTWDVLLDGQMVTFNRGATPQAGRTTRCKSPAVDYVAYGTLRQPTDSEVRDAGFYDAIRRNVDRHDRTRVPYGFATDSWADTGNLAVFRHDNGADPYELFNFFITEQETRHIFDNYRRERTTFSIRSASTRALGRYNEKMRDGAKGLGLLTNIYRDFSLEIGLDFDQAWPALATAFFPENVLASGIAFDHFSRQLFRPQAGPHTRVVAGDPFLRSFDQFGQQLDGSDTQVTMPNGATGYFGQVSYGAKPVNNALSDKYGEFDRDYQINAGSYYDKVYAPYLFTESADNFISDELNDFVDPRRRSVSMADMFPDGYRRLLANSLTGDDFIKGVRIASTGANPSLDGDGYPSQGLGTTTWWTPQPQVCFPGAKAIMCTAYGCPEGTVCTFDTNSLALNGTTSTEPNTVTTTVIVDPQVGWEQQKWMIAMTLLYLPSNQKTNWIDSMGLWELGADNDPEFTNRIELHLPDGRTYIARTFGTEDLFGRIVQRGVGARVLEYANDLLRAAYVCNEVLATPATGASWCEPVLNNGKPIVKFDSTVDFTAADCNGGLLPADPSDDVNTGCTCTSNRACRKLEDYRSVPAFIRQSMHDFRMADATMQGIYD